MGKLREAETLLRQVGAQVDHTHSLQYQQSLFRIGTVYLEWNDLERAEFSLRRGEEIAVEAQVPLWRAWLSIFTRKKCTTGARGNAEIAFAENVRAGEFANQIGWHHVAREASAYQARWWLSANQFTLAKRWADSCDSIRTFRPNTTDRSNI